MALTISRSVATKMTSSLAGDGASVLAGGTIAAQPASPAAMTTDESERATCLFMARVYLRGPRRVGPAFGPCALPPGTWARLSRTGIVLTRVTRNNEGHLAYRSQSEPPRGRGTTLGGRTDDPRGEGTRTAAACHPARRAGGQCQPSLPGGRDLAGLVLSLAPAAGALRAGRRASPPAPGPRRPAGAAGAGDRTPAAERGGERGDVGRPPDRGVPATPLAAARSPQHGAAGV